MNEQPCDPTEETSTAVLLARLATLEAQITALTAQACVAEDPGHPEVHAPAASRRHLLRYGAIALGAAAAGLAARSADAADNDPVLVGHDHTGTSPTIVRSSTDFSTPLEGISTGTQSTAVIGFNSGLNATGVAGSSTGPGSTYGVYASSNSTEGTGAYGFNDAISGSTVGLRGEVRSPAGFAVYGLNGAGGTAVLGVIPALTNQNGIALYGLNNSTYTGPGPGAGGFGVYGLSARGHGLVGATAADGGAAVVGATNGVAGAYAAAFYGPVVVSGDFTVVGAKSAAVPHPDGSHRRLYCVESPESWFEDFGTGELECGRADVRIDADFAAVADTTSYHVFLTGYDTEDLLRVTNRTPGGFTVEANKAIASMVGKADADLQGAFSWRVVAKRKDIPGPRLETVTIPPEPTLPAGPDVPTAKPPLSKHR